MSRFLRTQILTTKFDGDDVTVEMRPIDLPDFLALGQAFSKSAARKGDDGKLTAAEAPEMFGTDVLPMLKKYVTSLKGLRDAAGAEVSAEDALTFMYFSKLQTDIAMAILTNATVQNPTLPAEAP